MTDDISIPRCATRISTRENVMAHGQGDKDEKDGDDGDADNDDEDDGNDDDKVMGIM